jgi:RNA-directed DNA polymerase
MNSFISDIHDIFKPERLKTAFKEIDDKRVAGINRITPEQFSRDLKGHLNIIYSKCIKGAYTFSPYLEKLMLKGKNKFPRVISIPVVRDRIVLYI